MTSTYITTMLAFLRSAEDIRRQGDLHLMAFDATGDYRHLERADDCRMQADACASMARAAA